jgi:transposase InsO family protein
MNVHSNARLTPRSRALLVKTILEEGLTVKRAAARFTVSERTAAKWLGRFRTEGSKGLMDRSSAPAASPRRTPAAQVAVVLSLRRLRLPGFQIARLTALSKATVSRILATHRLSSLSALDPAPPVVRYQRQHPGELLHFDIKKLGRIVRPSHRVTGNRRDRVAGAGWEYVHIAIDDASRIAFAQILPDERSSSVISFLLNTLAYFASLGIEIQRLMTDNGSAYRSHLFAKALRLRRIRHLFTKPYTPKTNGKAERFIQTSLREWAYAAVYSTSSHRLDHLAPWLHRYNWHRPHSALHLRSPISTLPLSLNNLLRLHT